jgi:hypothetical protein
MKSWHTLKYFFAPPAAEITYYRLKMNDDNAIQKFRIFKEVSAILPEGT